MDTRTTASIHDEFRRAGYDLEEEYFYRENRRAIDRLRALARRRPDPYREPEEAPRSVLQRVVDFIFKPRPVGSYQFPV